MKQRTRVMHNGDELVTCNMVSKNEDLVAQNEIQLHKMKPPEHFIEAQILEGDSLQAIALRFHSSISELKRINHIHKDNEIFARRTIKVPVTPYSVLTETLPSHVVNPVPSTSKEITRNPLFQDLALSNHNIVSDQNVQGNNNLIVNNDCEIDYNTIVLNSKLAPSVVPYTDTELLDPVTEDTQLLPGSKNKDTVEAVVVKQLTSQGADFGLKWYHLLSCILILGVLIPLFYVLFVLEKPHEILQHANPDKESTITTKQVIIN